MLVLKPHTAIVTLAVLLSTTGPAFASASVPLSTSHIDIQTRVGRETAGKRVGPGTEHPVSTGGSTSAVTAGATGDGPATQEDCDRFASAINSWQDQVMVDGAAGQMDQAIQDMRNADALQDKALDEGCFIID
jgi:hypothetical protein